MDLNHFDIHEMFLIFDINISNSLQNVPLFCNYFKIVFQQ